MAEQHKMMTIRVPEADMAAFTAMAWAEKRPLNAWVLEALRKVVGTPTHLPGTLKDISLSKEQVQRSLGVSKSTLEKLVRDGGLPSFYVGKRRRFLVEEVRRWRLQVNEADGWKEKRVEVPASAERKITVAQVAELLGVSKRTIRRWMADAGLPHEGSGSGTRMRWGEVREWYAVMQVRKQRGHVR